MTAWLLSDHLWEQWMVRARTLFATGDHDDAGCLWQASLDTTRHFAENDPRRAASLDALGTLATAHDDHDRAEGLYGQALDAWCEVEAWVDVMGTAQAARSSLFHLRLESKHPGAYPQITRARHTKTAGAGRAGATANLASLRDDSDCLRQAMTARRGAFGMREVGAAVMAAALGEPVDAEVIDRWTERPPQRFDDERRLYAAALLAPVLVRWKGRS